MFGEACGDFRAEPRRARCLVHDHAAAGLAHRFVDGVEVQWFERSDIDHFRADALLGKHIGGFQGLLHLCAPGHQGHVAAIAQHEADIQRQGLAIVGDFLLVLPVDTLGLEENHRIRIADGGQQQAVGARRR